MNPILNALTSRTRRERLLLIGFLGVAAIVWTSSLIGQLSNQRAIHEQLNRRSSAQQLWASREDAIEAQLAASRAELQSELIFTSNQLAEFIDTLARDLGINCELSNPVSEDGEVFAVHSLSMTIRGETIGSLLFFEDYLLDEAPYLVIREVRLSPVTNDPRLINASFIVEAFELKENGRGENEMAL